MARTIKWLSRLRHARGFGVHSPFAYRLIHEAIRDKSRYYDFDQLKGSFPRLLFRLAVFLQPASIEAIGNADITGAQQACKPRPGRQVPRYVPAQSVEMAVAGTDAEPQQVLTAVESGKVVVWRHGPSLAAEAKSVMASLPYGLSFSNRRSITIYVPLPSLPRQDISLSF